MLADPERVTVVPGNHDRYTTGSVRRRHFEEWFGVFAPAGPYPWLRRLDEETAVLGLDATRAHHTATGHLPARNFMPRKNFCPNPRRGRDD